MDDGGSSSSSSGSTSCTCTVPDGGAKPNQSGSRLLTRSIVGDDGSRQLSRMFDTTFSAPCTYVRLSDTNELYCLPDVSYGSPNGSYLFSDPSCTVPISDTTSSQPQGTQPTFFASYLTFSSTTKFWRVGTAIPTNDPIYTVDGACVSAMGSWYPGVRYNEVVLTEYGVTDFVQGTEE